MKNNICHKFVHLVLSLLLVSFKTATATTSLGQPTIERARNFKCSDKERHALLDFKANIQQDPNGYLSTWTLEEKEETKDCCEWFGVTCNNQTGHVTSLFLQYGDLGGNISPSLLNLSYLNKLDLSYNSFHGTIPRFIVSLTKLRYLNFANNSFHGTIPRSIGSLTKLLYLDLSHNSFHGTIPRSIGFMTKLEYLDLSNSSLLYGTMPPELGNLSNLQQLILDGIFLGRADKWVNMILSLQKLSFLSLDGCHLSRVMRPYSPSVNSSSSSIVNLNLRNNNLNASMYHWLFPLTNKRLEELDLSGNKLDGIPTYLGNLCSLTSLYFSDNSMPINFPDFLNKLSGCTSVTLQRLMAGSSQFTGSLSNNIQKFSSLKYLYIPDNHLDGIISDKVWELPKLLLLQVSFNSLQGFISEQIGKSRIKSIDLSENSLKGVPFEAHMSSLSLAEDIDLNSCKLGPHFPKWIQKLKKLTYLDISKTMISDTIPRKFWNTWPSQLVYLNLSSNNITGKVTDLLSNFYPKFSVIDLSSNNFYGPIPNVPSTLETLDLSRNKFYGGITFLCQIVDGLLSSLDLSNNLLTGEIPDCLWHFKNLRVLNLGHNNLSGMLPSSIDKLINLEVLYLYNNNFSGELPPSLKGCTKLTFLQLGANKFSGNVPGWIGENLLELYALSLTTNNFFGMIPLQLCQLINLQILDLSMNNLYGTIPSCLSNITSFVQNGFSSYQNVHRLYFNLTHTSEYVDYAMLNWQGSIREFSSTLGLVKTIDLSSNNLTGKIPYELTDLHELLALNLSMNTLLGEIPSNISEMKGLQMLDLSQNRLSGGIPTGTQLQSFEPSRYIRNARLCGDPLPNHCSVDKELETPPLSGESEDDKEGTDDVNRWFYIGGTVGFAIGFWIACSFLLVNRRGRHVFFYFMNSLESWVYVKVMVFIAKWGRVARQ